MIYRVTFSHGQMHEFEGDRLEDNGLRMTIWNGDELVIRMHDNSITSIEAITNRPIETGELYKGITPKEHAKLYDGNGETIAVYRKVMENE